MKLLIATVVAAVTLLSLTRAAVLPPPDHVKTIFEAPHSTAAAVVPLDQNHELYWSLATVTITGFHVAHTGAFDLIYKLTNATEGFSTTVRDEIQNEIYWYSEALSSVLLDVAFHRSKDTPMSEIAADFHKQIAIGQQELSAAQGNVKRLVEAENPKLLPLVRIIFAGSNAAITTALAPTVAYLSLFTPSQ